MENCDFSMTHDNFTMQSWGSAMTLENLYKRVFFFTMDHASSERFKRRQVTQAAEYWQALQEIDGFGFQNPVLMSFTGYLDVSG